MNKKRIWTVIAAAAVLGLGFLLFKQILPARYVPADDEIALHIQLNTKEDIGLLVYDYRADDAEMSGGISNANKSRIKHGSDIIQVWSRQELHSSSDTVALWFQFRVITEYVDPNYENMYPEDITAYMDPIAWKAHFGETYSITITGDKRSGYQAALN